MSLPFQELLIWLSYPTLQILSVGVHSFFQFLLFAHSWRAKFKVANDRIIKVKIVVCCFLNPRSFYLNDCDTFRSLDKSCSNYDIFLTRDCLAYSKVKPAVNQIETHPYFQRDSLVKFCQKHGICVTAHTPLGGSVANTEWFGSISCLDEPVLKGLAEKYNKTVAQVVLRWGIQRNTVVIPKSCKSERLKENIEVFDFELSEEDMGIIKSLDKEYRTNQPAKFWGINLYA